MCFRGTGVGMGKQKLAEETAQYHDGVIVQWQRKAWYDAALCKKWAVLATQSFILKSEGHHLLLCDNLSGQTTDGFKKILKKGNAIVHNLLAGCTDEIQVPMRAVPCRAVPCRGYAL